MNQQNYQYYILSEEDRCALLDARENLEKISAIAEKERASLEKIATHLESIETKTKKIHEWIKLLGIVFVFIPIVAGAFLFALNAK